MADQLMFLLVVGTAVWVSFDSRELEMSKGRLGGGPVDMGRRSWVVCCLLLWVIAFPCYLVARSRYVALRDAPLTPTADPVSPFAPVHSAFTQTLQPLPARDLPPVAAAYVARDLLASQQHGSPVVEASAPAAPPQLSADGYWWWTGTEWVPAEGVRLSQV